MKQTKDIMRMIYPDIEELERYLARIKDNMEKINAHIDQISAQQPLTFWQRVVQWWNNIKWSEWL